MTSHMQIVYFGSPVFSARLLARIVDELKDTVTVTAVVTQPDRPVGRKQIRTKTPVKEVAEAHALPVYEDINSPQAQQALKESDLALLYAYGLLLDEKILKLPRWGFWNIHPSLLPTYRGTSPIAYSLLMGDSKTGVSLMEMDNRMDHGPIIDKEEYVIQSTDTRTMLEYRLSDIGYELFKFNVHLLHKGALHKSEQNHQQATFTRLLTKKDGYIPYEIFKKIIQGQELVKEDIPPITAKYHKKYRALSTVDTGLSTFHLFRGLSPWPGVWTMLPNEKRLKITGMEIQNGKPIITRIQLEGKKEVAIKDFQFLLH